MYGICYTVAFARTFGLQPCDHLPHVSLQSAESEGAVWQQLERKCAENSAVLAVLYKRREAQLQQQHATELQQRDEQLAAASGEAAFS
jgi:hypothetical protein